MIIFNYNRVLKDYEPLIMSYANRINKDIEDMAQEIRIYVFENLSRFDPNKASLSWYIPMIIKTSYRKLVFQKKNQQIFEEEFFEIRDEVVCVEEEDSYDITLFKILEKLHKVTGVNRYSLISVFWALVYNNDDKNYSQLSEKMKAEYTSFLKYTDIIKKVTREVIEERQE